VAYRSFREFVDALEKAGELTRVTVPVDTDLLIAEWADREMKSPGGGKALLFEQPIVDGKKSEFPVAINTMGSRRRMALALQVGDIEDVAREIQLILKAKPPTDLREGWNLLKQGIHLLHARPKSVRDAPCQEVVHRIENGSDFSLDDLPILKCWPKDGGRFITFPLVITKSPADGRQNMGVYRMHLYGKNQTGMHWQIAKGGGYHYQEAESRGEPLKLVAVVGADPVLLMCGVLPLPEGLDEMAFAGFLRGESTRVTRLAEGALAVPAEAEFALEGTVPPQESRMEGPYGDHFGHYSLAAPFPVFHVDRIWHRPGAVFPIAVVGKPPQEDQVIGDAVQEILLPLLKIMHPELVDLWAYQQAGFQNYKISEFGTIWQVH